MSANHHTITIYGNRVKYLFRPLLIFVALIWALEMIDKLIFNGSLDNFGIIPRQFIGLRGVLLSPVLHSGFGHLAANTIPFLVLGFMLMWRQKAHILEISAIILLVSGLGTWLVAPSNTVTIGASGLVFGYFAFLVVNAWYEKSVGAILFAALVVIAYGGMIWGIIPAGNDVSWQSHLFGLLGGLGAAYFLDRRKG